MDSIGTPLMWAGFAVFLLLALAVDLWVMRTNGPHRIGQREAVIWSAIWIGLALTFNAGLWFYLRGTLPEADATRVATEFLTGYLVEKALAVDNIFVFLMVFTYFAVPAEFQKRVLMIGILGALVLRAVMILVGAWLIVRFHWVLYLFGAFLVFTGIKMWWAAGQEPDLESNPALKWIRRHMRIAPDFDGEKFFTVVNGAKTATPLFLVILLIGIVDIVFAVDSIPAIFAITTDPFIVLTSNVFAILGLRAMYFLLAGLRERFHLLTYGLAIVLILIGGKMLLIDVYKIPVAWSLAATASVLAATMVLSLYIPARGYTGSAYPFRAKPGKGGSRAKGKH